MEHRADPTVNHWHFERAPSAVPVFAAGKAGLHNGITQGQLSNAPASLQTVGADRRWE